MRILLHSRSFLPRIGGLEQVGLLLARELTRRGHIVLVATDTPGDPEADRSLEFEVARQRTLRQLVALARKADLVHSNGHSMLAIAISRAAGIPLVMGHQGYQAACLSGLGWHGGARCDYRLPRCVALTLRHEGILWTGRQLLRHVAARISLGSAAAHVAASAKVAAVLRAKRTFVVPNAADTSVFHPEPGGARRQRFLFVGRLVGEKGVDFLLKTYFRYRQESGKAGLDIVGAGPEEPQLRSLVRRLGIMEHVSFRGSLVGRPLADAMRTALAVLVPSVWDEAFGIVAAEALSCGTIALVSDAGGLPEVVEGLGTAVPQGDEIAWAKALHRVVFDQGWREFLEERIPAVAQRFTEARMADGYLRVFEWVLCGRAESSSGVA